MRPHRIRKAVEEVYKTLWTHPDHELVELVRERILEKHRDLKEELSNADLLQGNRLSERLAELGPNGTCVIAAVLWASKFDPPHSETLFRILVPFASSITFGPGGERSTADSHQVDHEEQRSHKAELRRMKRAQKQARKSAEQKQRELLPKERALSRTKHELEEARGCPSSC